MLGSEYAILASMGHVRDLPEHEFGINIADNFAPQYTETPRSRQVLKSLKEAAKKSDEIFLATDPDREGEAIAWHLKSLLEKANKKATFHRVTFHEITRSAIEQAISQKGDIDLNLVDAQQARRVLDRIVGYQVSPLLWRKLGKGSSAGRVQSAALRLIVEREREIRDFTPEEYWNFSALFQAEPENSFKGKLFKIDGKDFQVSNAADAENIENAISRSSDKKIAAVSISPRKRNPYPPFTTSTLQQAANQQLRYSASSTMRYAQQLYEGIDLGDGSSAGLITYMRTDSVTIAREAQIAAADFIRETYGKEFLPAKFNVYKNKAASQEAHEAIRPTDVRKTPQMLAQYLDPAQLKLYTLIWKRFVASQMEQAKQELVSVDVIVNGVDSRKYNFRASATVVTFPGFLSVYSDNPVQEKEECRPDVLKALKKDTPVTITKFIKEQKFTEPPPRFTEATLIKLLEENGVGRPSTYATILRTIQERRYVAKEQHKLLPTELGFEVNDFLTEKLPELFDVGFTAQMEQQLDDVESGSLAWIQMMTDFYSRFSPWLANAQNADAPPPEKAAELLNFFADIKFEPKQKIGSKTFDDERFVRSIREKFEKNSNISAKQYQALLGMFLKYREQIDPANDLSEFLRSDINEAEKELLERQEAEKLRPPVPEGSGYAPVFEAFENVSFQEAKSGRSFFDEAKFIKSLKNQTLSGKPLSDKQLSVLKRIVLKYQSQIADRDDVFSILDLEKNPEISSEQIQKQNESVENALKFLSEVTKWEAPVKKGRFTFDDKKFYTSIARQFKENRELSSKQIAALIKLAEKYQQNGAGKNE